MRNFLFGDERIAQTHVFTMDDVEVFYDLPLYGILLVRGIVRSTAQYYLTRSDTATIRSFLGWQERHYSLFFILGLGVTLANFRKLQYLIPSVWFLAGFFFLGATCRRSRRDQHTW